MRDKIKQYRLVLLFLPNLILKYLKFSLITLPHRFLSHKSKIYKKWLNFKYSKQVNRIFIGIFSLFILGTIGSLIIQKVLAYTSWVQSDWSGGVGTSTVNQYSSSSNVITSTANQITLGQQTQQLSNTNFATNLSGWNEGVLPSTISGLMIWLKADAITGLSDGASISSWPDSSGNNLNATQSNTGDQPIYKANIINGEPVVRFNGTSDYMETSDWSGTLTNRTLIAVTTLATLNPTGNSAGEGIFTTQVPGSDNFDSISYNEYTAQHWQNGSTNWWRTPNTIPTAAETSLGPHIIVDRQATTDFELWEDGTNLTTTNSYSPSSATNGFFTIGNRVDGSTYGQGVASNGYWNGDAAELIAYNSALTTAQRQGIEAYLQGKYAINAGYATITRNTTTTYNGDTASAKIVNSNTNPETFTQIVNVGNTNPYDLTAYAYTTGGAVTSSNAQLYYNGSAISTTYTSVGSGWYQLSAVVNGVNSSTTYGVSIAGNQTVYLDNMSLINYDTTGSVTSAILNTGIEENWGNLSYSATIPSGSTVSVLVRSGNQSNLSDAPAFTSCSAITSGSTIVSTCAPIKTQYVQYEINFTSTGSVTPIFTSITIPYSPSDTTPPVTNASAITAYDGPSGASVSSDSWANVDPYFSWTAGADNTGGSGIQGYCLYLGQDPTGNPVTSEGDLGTSPVNTAGACPFVVSGTSINTAVNGYLGTALTSSNSPYYLNIKAIDNADNVYNGSSDQFEFLFDNTPPTNPAFITAPSEFVSSKTVTLTWQTTGSVGPSDANSGVAGLQYKIGSGGTWYGVNHNGNQDMTDLLVNNGSYTTVSNPDYNNLSEGDNIVYFRTWDNAGNVSPAYVTTVIKINTTSPSTPQNLTATPTTNSTNSFAFSWLAPASFTGYASNITYCYTINVLPNSSNCTYTAAGQTSLDAGAYATEPGDNTFYLVARDEADNINYATAASTTFTANTPAPGIPLNPDIADISTKSTSTWKLALSWNQPTSVGAGIATYKILRSTDGYNYTNIASTAGTSYVDSNLSQQTYYYEIEACDSANNCGGLTTAVSDLPTGKYTTPANLISGPDVTVNTRTATINWTTDRDSDSSIEYGLSSGNYFATSASNSQQVTSHSIELNDLNAGTTYYYSAQWTDEDGNIGTSQENSFTTLPAPTVSNVTVSNINLSNATISFTTDNATAVQLQYGGGLLSNSQVLNTSTDSSNYAIPLSNLNSGTTYSFKLNPYDTSDNIYDNPTTFTFTTPPQPVITNVEFSPVPGALTGTEDIFWTTNVPATSQISYGLVDGDRFNQLDTTLTTSHEMTINNLTYNTEYSVTATSIDSLGNVANSDLQIFKSGIDTRPPIISDVVIQPSIVGTGASAKGQLIVSWKTDKTGTSQVAYGNGNAGDYTTTTAEDNQLVNNHVVVISGLATSEVYHVEVISNDADGIKGISNDQTTIIGQSSDNALSIVFNSLQNIFGL